MVIQPEGFVRAHWSGRSSALGPGGRKPARSHALSGAIYSERSFENHDPAAVSVLISLVRVAFFWKPVGFFRSVLEKLLRDYLVIYRRITPTL